MSRKWISDILRKKIRYNGLIVSDDLELGAVLNFAPIEQTAIQHIRAGGDLALICHKEEMILRAYEALIHEAERDRKFASRVAQTIERTQILRRKLLNVFLAKGPSRNSPKAERLSRQLWEFGEEVRVAALANWKSMTAKKKGRA